MHERSMLFVSHANPEDNEFARWLALRLAAEGYPVWCDLTQLLGGERFWSNIEEAIRLRTIKFLFVLSRSSNVKTGPQDELGVALSTQKTQGLEDFVIPLWVDDLPAADFNVRLNQINAIPFNTGWASGLGRLLAKLDESDVARDSRFSPTAVGTWWAENVSASRGLRTEPESLITNVYPIRSVDLFVYREKAGLDSSEIPIDLSYYSSRGLITSFESLSSIAPISAHIDLQDTLTIGPDGLPPPPQGWSHGEIRRAVTALLNQHWSLCIDRSGLPQYTFSGGRPSVFFTLDDVGLGRVTFSSPSRAGSKSWRQLMGFKTMAAPSDEPPRRRYWHFALEARATSDFCIGFVMKPHVLFSDDGLTVWDDDDRLHRARRSQCKNWWNDKWRDLIQAGLATVAGQESVLDLSTDMNGILQVSTTPVLITAPVSYEDPEHQPLVEQGSEDTGKTDDDYTAEDGDEEEWA